MKTLLRHLLLLGAMLGLFWQGMAYATPPCAEMQQDQSVAMAGMPDCAMGEHKPDKVPAPCKDMSPGCLAMAGCAALAAIDASPSVALSPLSRAAAAAWPATPILLGRSEPPDPYPPSFLG